MQKQLLFSALLIASGSAITYDIESTWECFVYDSELQTATLNFAAGLTDVTAEKHTYNTAGTEYNHAYDITLSATGDYYCQQTLIASWSAEWTVNTADSSDSDAAFAV
jgi:hypothetical protein